MKIFTTVLLLILASLNSYGQLYAGAGITKYNSDISDIGSSISLGYNKFHFDVSTNWARGQGEQLEFQSSSTFQLDKKNIFVINFGYNYSVNDDFIVTPVLGLASSSDIFQDPILFDSWFLANEETILNLGVIAKYYFSYNYGISAAVGTFELFRFSLEVKG